jgi:hypothetical protein
MSIIDRIKGLFGGKQTDAEYGAATGGAVAATEHDDSVGDADSQSGSGWSGESGGDGGGGSGDGGGGGGGT